MSWQDYVDNQLIASQCVSKACIAGHDGGVWAKSEGFEVSLRVADDFISQFSSSNEGPENSIFFFVSTPDLIFSQILPSSTFEYHFKMLQLMHNETPAKLQPIQ